MALFDVRRGEGALVLQSTGALFGLIAAHTMLETARDALFLGVLDPDRLPLVYVLLAGLAVVAARGNTRFVQAFGRRNALVVTLLFAAYGTIVIYLLPSNRYTVFGLYVWSALLGTVMVVQFWMYSGHLYTVAQGARLFGLIAAGGVLGAVTGATVSVAVLRFIPVDSLLLVGAGMFLATAAFCTTMRVDSLDPPARRKKDPPLRSGFGLFKQHPYLLRIAGLLAVSTAAVLITDYLFKSAAARAYSAEELGSFFASYYAVLNTIALIVQVFVASRLVDRAGVITAFLVLPAMLLAGGVATLLLGGAVFAAVLITKGADGSLRHSLHRIASELLWLPLPDQVRARSKAFVDTVVVRSVQAVVAGFLLLLATLELDSIRVLGALVAVLAAGWIIWAMSLRGPYLDLFRSALNRQTPDERRALQLDLNSVELVVEALSSRDATAVVAAMELLKANGRAGLIPGLILYHEDEEVLVQALAIVGTPERRDWVPLAERLLDHASATVRVAALRALAARGERSVVEGRMFDINPYVRAHAAFWLANDRPKPREDEGVRQILEMAGDAGVEARIGIAEAIRSGGDDRWSDVLWDLLQHENPRQMEASVLAIERIRDERFIPLLIDFLSVRSTRDVVREAIVELGEPALEALHLALEDEETPREIRRHIPRTISRFMTQNAADILLERLEVETDGVVRFKTLRGLCRMIDNPALRMDSAVIDRRLNVELREYLRLQAISLPIERGIEARAEGAESGKLLTGLLGDKMSQALERIFRLLQLAHRGEDLRSVSFAVRSTDKNVRAQALEFLSALTLSSTFPENRDLIRVIVDDLSVEEKLLRVRQLVPEPPPNHEAAVLKLLEDRDGALAGIAAYHGLELGGLDQDVIQVSKEGPLWTQVKAMLEGMSGLREAPSVV